MVFAGIGLKTSLACFNIDIFDFELTADDMAKMSSLDKNESQFFDHRDPAAIESIFGQSLKALRN